MPSVIVRSRTTSRATSTRPLVIKPGVLSRKIGISISAKTSSVMTTKASSPGLGTRDAKGDIYTVRYEAVNAMLLNEFLKEHRKVQELKNDFQATVARQQKEIQALAATVKEQAAQIQKVSAQLEVNKPAPQTVLNNQ